MKKLFLFTILLSLTGVLHSQSAQPNSFLDLKLGLKISDFLKNNVDAAKGSYWCIHTDIKADGMTIYTVKRKTKSGDEVQVDCCFYNDLLSVINVKYPGYQMGNDLLDGLKAKYGPFTKSNVFEWTDALAGASRTTATVYWNKPTCILNFIYTEEIGYAELVFAERTVQQKLRAAEQKKNVSKIE